MTETFNPWTKSAGGFDVRPSGPAGYAGGHAAAEGLRPVQGTRPADAARLRALPLTTSIKPLPGVLPARRQALNQLVTS